LKSRAGALCAVLLLLSGCVETDPAPSRLDTWTPDGAFEEVSQSGDDAEIPHDEIQERALPPELLLTFNELPQALNGSLPYRWAEAESESFRPRANGQNMTIDLLLQSGSGPVDWNLTELQCGERSLDPAELDVRSDDHARVHFSAQDPFETPGETTCTATLFGPGGTDSMSLVVEAVQMPQNLDPFVSPDVWLVTLDRDLFDLQVTPSEDGAYEVISLYEPAGNSIADLDESLVAIGLMSETNLQAASQARSALLAVVREETRLIFGLDASGQIQAESVPVTVFFQGDAGAPLMNTYDGKSFSMMALGGDGTPEEQPTGLVGRALVDPNNQDHENNTTYGLGVYPSAIVRQVLGQPIGALALGPMMPPVGVPMGEHPGDDLAMDPSFDPLAGARQDVVERHQLYRLVIDLLGQALAATLAHEIGHSLGLVPPGPPPMGLFADMPALSLTDHDIDGWHIDTPGLNIMQTGAVTSWFEAVGQEMRFNALNIAYLRRRLVVGAMEP
jgi:hypothetical protein